MITAKWYRKANEVLKNVVERTPLDFDRYYLKNTGRPFILKNMQGTFLSNCEEPTIYSSIGIEDKARGVQFVHQPETMLKGCLHL